MDRCGSFPLLSTSHSLFSIWTDLKRSKKIPGTQAWRWGEWIWVTGSSELHGNSPQGLNISSVMRVYWPDQRSGNPNHLPQPYNPSSELIYGKSRILWKIFFSFCNIRIYSFNTIHMLYRIYQSPTNKRSEQRNIYLWVINATTVIEFLQTNKLHYFFFSKRWWVF